MLSCRHHHTIPRHHHHYTASPLHSTILSPPHRHHLTAALTPSPPSPGYAETRQSGQEQRKPQGTLIQLRPHIACTDNRISNK
ncbi:hypothetical protein PoB_005534700 [Plakobranchus ocellatus]|uniref:Uncharacterized protein n=1 Tax=Plakobranchus ocellatus TaxID=259542 RepID=A0AAV4CBD3_9GAST|nr:hypothetical protein PoB_005534700 [Plakobranchus ocellatus]